MTDVIDFLRAKLAPRPLPVTCNTHHLLTPRGLMDCSVKEFDAQKYRGINYNTRKRNRKTK